MHHGADGAHECDGLSVLEGIASDRNAGRAGVQRSTHGLEDHGVVLRLLPTCDQYRNGAAFHHLCERPGRAGVADLHDIGAEFGRNPRRMLDAFDTGLGLELVAARVHHRKQRHAPAHALHRHVAEVLEHVGFVRGADVDVYAHAVRSVRQRILHGVHQDLGVRVRTPHRAAGQVENKSHVLAIPAVSIERKSHVSEHGIGAAKGHGIDHLPHVLDAGDGADGNAMVHRHDHGPARLAIDDALHAYRLAQHGLLSFQRLSYSSRCEAHSTGPSMHVNTMTP